jgi:hypothetical protein
MTKIMLPKKALERVIIGKSFAEYDIVRDDPDLFVSTSATIAAVNSDSTSCFFIGRRGAGKTAITYEVQRKISRTITINPQIFDLLELPLAHEEFFDTKQRPFKSLMCSMERAILGEVINKWSEQKIFRFEKAAAAVRRERGLIQDCDFDLRGLKCM